MFLLYNAVFYKYFIIIYVIDAGFWTISSIELVLPSFT